MLNVLDFRKRASRSSESTAQPLAANTNVDIAALASRITGLQSEAKGEIGNAVLMLDLAAQHAREIAARLADPTARKELRRTYRDDRANASARPRDGIQALSSAESATGISIVRVSDHLFRRNIRIFLLEEDSESGELKCRSIAVRCCVVRWLALVASKPGQRSPRMCRRMAAGLWLIGAMKARVVPKNGGHCKLISRSASSAWSKRRSI